MKRWLIRSVQVAALAMGGLALTGTAAHADWDSGPNVGFFNGNQSSTTVQGPVNVCGNSIAIIGFASGNCSGGAYAYNGSGGSYSGAGYNNGNSKSTSRATPSRWSASPPAAEAATARRERGTACPGHLSVGR